MPGAELARFNVESAKSRLRVWTLFLAVFGTASLLLPDGTTALGVSMPALLWPGLAAVVSCLGVIYLPLAHRHPWWTFYAQMVVGLVTLSVCIHLAATGDIAVAARLLFVLILVPPHLVSQRAGTVATMACIAAHLVLVGVETGATWAAFATGASIGPVVSFVLVAMMASAHAGYMGETSVQLRDLATHLDKSRRRLGRLVGLAKGLNESSDLEGLFKRVNGAVRREFRADWCATYRIDRSRGTFALAAASERPSGEQGAIEVEALPVLARLLGEGVVFLGAEVTGELAGDLGVPRSVTTIVLAALSRGNEMQGFLALGYRGERPRFTDGDLAQIAAVTEHATIALQKARLLDEERELSALKSEFLSTMSHELRTPINIIVGYVDMLRDAETGELNESQRELFASIERQARELNDLIESVLRVGKVEHGRDDLDIVPVDFDQLVATISSAVENLPHRDTVRMEWVGGDRIAGTICTDSSRVALVVRNLVGNAYKFTESGKVAIRFDREADDLLIEVADTGVGIPEKSLPHVFEMFRQAERSPGERRRGVGFGLYIVDQTVRRLGGTVRVTSKVGVGTTFHLRLPGFSGVALAKSA